MDTQFITIYRHLQAEDAKLTAIAKALMPLLAVASGRADAKDAEQYKWDELSYALNAAFDFEL